MSYVEVYAVRKNGNVELYTEVKNSIRWAHVVWQAMELRYLPPYRPDFVPDYVEDSQISSYLRFTPNRVSAIEAGAIDEVWSLYKNEKVSMLEKWALCSTFDRVIIEREAFNDLIHAYRTFFAFPEESNLPELADIIERMKEDDDIIGVAWSTSLIDSPWIEKLKVDNSHALWNEADEDWDWEDEDNESPYRYADIPYSIFKGDKHWFLNQESYMQAKG